MSSKQPVKEEALETTCGSKQETLMTQEDDSVKMIIKLCSTLGDSDGSLDVTMLESIVSWSISSSIKGVAYEYLKIWLEILDYYFRRRITSIMTMGINSLGITDSTILSSTLIGSMTPWPSSRIGVSKPIDISSIILVVLERMWTFSTNFKSSTSSLDTILTCPLFEGHW